MDGGKDDAGDKDDDHAGVADEVIAQIAFGVLQIVGESSQGKKTVADGVKAQNRGGFSGQLCISSPGKQQLFGAAGQSNGSRAGDDADQLGGVAVDADKFVVFAFGMQSGHTRHDGAADWAADDHDATGNQYREGEVAVFFQWKDAREHQLVGLCDQYPHR
ncbi:hypothetical protein D3C76_966010 [compost metagenome]